MEVDNKVVSIQFDNAAFQKKMSETIASLDKLRASLDLAGAGKGLNELSSATKNFSMDQVGVSVEGVSAKFAALATIGVTALSTLVSKAIEAGLNISKSLTIQPIGQGFSEFELKMGAIQTIMAGSGESLDVVNQKLAELNTYSDKTIYSFADMTQNIGKFTNAGVSLEDSVGAIKGISNAAALSGANAEEASRAMYNFAQALSTGAVKAIDWKSIELANMGTVEFKQQIIDTAVAMGTLKKSSDGTLKTLEGTEVTTAKFASTLADGWFTADVMTKSLNKFSDVTTDIGKRATAAAQDVKTFSQMLSTMKESAGSGWATTFEAIFGGFEEGKVLWTGLNEGFNNIVGASANARNEMLAQWKKLGGRNLLLGGFYLALKGIGSVLKPIRDAFRDVFPKTTAKQLVGMTLAFTRFAARMRVTSETASKIRDAFRGFFAILSIGWEVVKGVSRVFFALAGALWKIFSPLLNLVSGSGSLIYSFQQMLVKGKGIETFFDGLVSAIGSIGSAIAGVVGGFSEFVSELGLFQAIGAGLAAAAEALGRAGRAVRDFFSSLSFGKDGTKDTEEAGKNLEKTASLADRLLAALKNVFSQIGSMLSGIGNAITGFFSGLGAAIGGALGSGNFDNVLNLIKVGLLGKLVFMLKNFLQFKFFDKTELAKKMKQTLGAITGALKSLQANIRADTLLKIAKAVGILTISIVVLSLINPVALGKSMVAITAGFAQLTGVMLILEKNMNEASTAKIFAMGAAMVLLATAMAILTISIFLLSRMDPIALAQGVIGVGAAMAFMSASMQLIPAQTAGLVTAGVSMVFMSVALLVLAKAIKSFAKIKWQDMLYGLAAAAIGLRILIWSLSKVPKDIERQGIGLVILAFALGKLAGVVTMFSNIPLIVIARGFLFMAGGLVLLGKGIDSFPNNMTKRVLDVLLLSGALMVMGKAIEQVGNLKLGTLAKGVGALSVMLFVLAVAIAVISEAEGGVAGLFAAAAALYVLGKAIEVIGKQPVDQLLTALGVFAAFLIILGVASLIGPELFVLGLALTAVGVGLLFVGAGVALAAVGFSILSQLSGPAIDNLKKTLKELITLIPELVVAFVQGFIDAGVALAKQVPKLTSIFVTVLTAILDAIIEVVPKVGEALSKLIDEGIRILTEAIPKFIALGWSLITGYLQGIRDNIGEIVTLVSEIIQEFLDAMSEEMPDLVDSLVNFLATAFQEVARGLGELMPRIMIGVGRSFLEGFWTGLKDELGKLGEVIGGIITDIIDWFKEKLGIKSPSTVMAEMGKNIILGLINGVKAMFGLLKTLFIDIPVKIIKWLGNLGKTLLQKGRDVIQGLWNGITEVWNKLKSWVSGFGASIGHAIGNLAESLLGIGRSVMNGLWNGMKEIWEKAKGWLSKLNPANWFNDINPYKGHAIKNLVPTGGAVMQGLLNGMQTGWDHITNWLQGVNPAESFSEASVSSFGAALASLKDQLPEIDGFHPTITPVLDLSQIQDGAKGIDALMRSSDVVASASIGVANGLSTSLAAVSESTPAVQSTGPTQVTFEQNNYSPKALSTGDIYRNHKSQIALAKEELNIS